MKEELKTALSKTALKNVAGKQLAEVANKIFANSRNAYIYSTTPSGLLDEASFALDKESQILEGLRAQVLDKDGLVDLIKMVGRAK